MSMTQKEQRALAIECGGDYTEAFEVDKEVIVISPEQLEAYTVAVEAKERERIAAEIDLFGESHTVYGKLAEFIRSLK